MDNMIKQVFKEKIMWKNGMLKYILMMFFKTLILIFVMAVLFMIFKPNPNETPEMTEEQLQCDHEYIEVDWHVKNFDITRDIYCPKCKYETTVNSKEWNKIQADIKYKQNSAGANYN